MSKDNITVLCVPPTHFGRVLAVCHEPITRGLKLCGIDHVRDVAMRIERADMQLWLVTDGVETLGTCFTDINVEPDGSRWVGVYGLAGQRITKWARPLSDRLAAFARAESCSRVLFAGRAGWEKLLPECRRIEKRGDQWVWERRVAH